MSNTSFRLDHLLELSGHDISFVVEILDSFVEKAREELAECLVLAEKQTWEELKFVVHRLRSSAGSVGAKRIASHCASIENILSETDAKNKKLNDYLARFHKESKSEIEEIEKAIELLKEGLQGGMS